MSQHQRIGIFASSLSDPFPRGVQRVARSIAEELVTNYSEDFQFVCLTQRITNQREITYHSYNLSEWLSNKPLREKIIVNQKSIFVLLLEIQERIKLLSPPILWSFFYSIFREIAILTKYFLMPLVKKKKFLKISGLLSLLGLNFIINSLPNFNDIYALKKNTFFYFFKEKIKLIYKLICPPLLNPLFQKYHLNKNFVDISKDIFNVESTVVTLNDLDIVISFDPFDEIWDLHISEYNTKFVGWFHDAIPLRINEGSNWNPERFSSCVSKMTHKADKIVCVSLSSEKDLKTFFPETQGKTLVIYNGHDLERFHNIDSKNIQKNTFSKFGICVDIPYIICVGVIEQRKNIVNILRACVHLKQKLPKLNFQLVIVGQEGDMPSFGSLIKQARQYIPVVYTGYADDKEVASLLSGALAFLYPSLWEGFGIPPLEAMTAGTLVVTSEVSSLPEVCGENAIYCNPYEIVTIADAIHQCLDMPIDERERIIQDSKVYASQFTWKKTVDQLSNLLRELSNM